MARRGRSPKKLPVSKRKTFNRCYSRAPCLLPHLLRDPHSAWYIHLRVGYVAHGAVAKEDDDQRAVAQNSHNEDERVQHGDNVRLRAVQHGHIRYYSAVGAGIVAHIQCQTLLLLLQTLSGCQESAVIGPVAVAIRQPGCQRLANVHQGGVHVGRRELLLGKMSQWCFYAWRFMASLWPLPFPWVCCRPSVESREPKAAGSAWSSVLMSMMLLLVLPRALVLFCTLCLAVTTELAGAVARQLLHDFRQLAPEAVRGESEIGREKRERESGSVSSD